MTELAVDDAGVLRRDACTARPPTTAPPPKAPTSERVTILFRNVIPTFAAAAVGVVAPMVVTAAATPRARSVRVRACAEGRSRRDASSSATSPAVAPSSDQRRSSLMAHLDARDFLECVLVRVEPARPPYRGERLAAAPPPARSAPRARTERMPHAVSPACSRGSQQASLTPACSRESRRDFALWRRHREPGGQDRPLLPLDDGAWRAVPLTRPAARLPASNGAHRPLRSRRGAATRREKPAARRHRRRAPARRVSEAPSRLCRNGP